MAEPEMFSHKKDRADRWLDLVTLMIILLNGGLVVYGIRQLPHTIPSHINFDNQIDGFGSKYLLMGPGIIGCLICALFFYLEERPGFITDSLGAIKTQEQYRIRLKTLISLKPLLAYTFLAVTVMMYETAQFQWLDYTNYFVVLILFPFPFHFLYWSLRYAKVA